MQPQWVIRNLDGPLLRRSIQNVSKRKLSTKSDRATVLSCSAQQRDFAPIKKDFPATIGERLSQGDASVHVIKFTREIPSVNNHPLAPTSTRSLFKNIINGMPWGVGRNWSRFWYLFGTRCLTPDNSTERVRSYQTLRDPLHLSAFWEKLYPGSIFSTTGRVAGHPNKQLGEIAFGGLGPVNRDRIYLPQARFQALRSGYLPTLWEQTLAAHITVNTRLQMRLSKNLSTVNFTGKIDKHNNGGSVQQDLPNPNFPNGVFVALGSNIGDRVGNIEQACREMTASGCKVLRTSNLYETKAMYVENQNDFINAICEISTDLEPRALLEHLKDLENKLGRHKTIDKGPRNIDLDILLYKDVILDDPDLSIPHIGIPERDFVLRPLCDLIPDAVSPRQKATDTSTFQAQLSQLVSSTPLYSYTPVEPIPEALSEAAALRRTEVMAILNVTPDSFSDGTVNPGDEARILDFMETCKSSGVRLIDIGGQSTRPGAAEVSADEELNRILPVIQLIRSNPRYNDVVISVDTFYASVASAAIKAGANIVNDISAGTMDPEMFPTVAKLGCPIILMHMRGTPQTMQDNTTYEHGVIQDIRTHLSGRVAAAEAAGIFRWRIILDPGIGFSKTQTQNLEILTQLNRLTQDVRDKSNLQHFPWLVGSSRKGFIGRITGVKEPRERVMGTAATVTAAIAGGAGIVRVHDIKEMVEVVRMADAIYKNWDTVGRKSPKRIKGG